MTDALPPYIPTDGVGTPLTGDGLILREWSESDLSAMVDLFNDTDIAYRLLHPFSPKKRNAARVAHRGSRVR
jgi:hypothetical protein